MKGKILLLFYLTIWFSTSYVTAYSGSGTEADPYQIATTADLITLSKTSAHWVAGKYFIQTANISFSADETSVDWDGDTTFDWASNGGDQYGFSPIGSSTTAFAGSYNGNGYYIENLFINRTNDNIGLFGYTSGATIQNLGVLNVDITGDNKCGGLAGIIEATNINNCYSTGEITGGEYTGGLIGYVTYNLGINSTIYDSYSQASVNGEDYTGGLIGFLFKGTIERCYSSGSVTGDGAVGGLIGWAKGVTTEVSLVIRECYSVGNVNGTSYVGGFVGLASFNPAIRDCYSFGDVTRSSGTATNIGGFCGQTSTATIDRCYSIGKVYQSSGVIWSDGTKGFIGTNTGMVVNDNFFDSDNSQQTSGTGATATTTANMKLLSTFSISSWNIDSEHNNLYTWNLESSINSGYPYLSWRTIYSGGSGTSSDPYLISTKGDVLYLSKTSTDWEKYFSQTTNISFSADETSVDWDGDGTADWDTEDQKGFDPIGNGSIKFEGSYDGNGYYIENLYINRNEAYAGFFGNLYSATANITELGITNIYIINPNNYPYFGGLAGRNKGSISKCYTTGSINGGVGYYTGGLVGGNSGTINESYSTADVEGRECGGLVGINEEGIGTINNSYSRGSVTRNTEASDYQGSFCGSNNGTIAYCYSTGSVIGSGSIPAPTNKGFVGYSFGTPTYTNNYFDTQTTGFTTGTGATGETTADMKINSTFTGWDGDIWNIGDGINDGYPYLDWQNTGGTPLPVELSLFTANKMNGKIELKWQTATEINNYGFEIERQDEETLHSTSSEWETIGFVQGHGNSNSTKYYSYTDNSSLNGTIKYRLKQIDFDGKYEYSDIIEVEINNLPEEFSLSQNYPNPFNPSTTINYSIPKESNVQIKVYDIIGNEICTLVNEKQSVGNYKVNFDVASIGRGISSGVYFYRIMADNFQETKKMLLIK